MTRLATVARWGAIAIAIAAAVDPEIPVARSERPAVRVFGHDGAAAAPVSRAVRDAGFRVDSAEGEAAVVLVGDRPPSRIISGITYFALSTAPPPPNVRVTYAGSSTRRLPQQALDVRATIEADGCAGRTTEIVLEDAGIPVAAARHEWKEDRERWQASLAYLPPGSAATRLRLRAAVLPGETSAGDNEADVAVPAVRGPIRTLVVEAAVTWPAMFVRRALEGEPAFRIAALQRASQRIATRAGAPPPALTRSTLAPFEVVLVGGPDGLSRSEIDALRWFVEVRGGVAVFVPDRPPTGRYIDLAGVSAFDTVTLDAPVRLGADLMASELVVPRALPPAATPIAADPGGKPVVFSVRRGGGAIIFSGALDAWRYRGGPDDAFRRFWRRAIASNASAVPPALEVAADPSIVRPGERTSISVRIRATEIPGETDRIELDGIEARAVSPGAGVDEGIRLWPTAEPGVYSGEWRARKAGAYNVSVATGSLRGDAAVSVAPGIARGSTADAEGLALVTRASGGEVFGPDRIDALVRAMEAAYPARRVVRAAHPMRSALWVVLFTGALCTEWALRRRRGLP